MKQLFSILLILALAAPSRAADGVTLGSAADAKWTGSTEEAAATPENKEWLKKGKTETVTGEVIDLSCYLQLGKKGEKHKACGTKCIQAGQQGALLNEKGDVYLLMPEQHHPRRDGQVSLKDWMATHMGEKATVTGVLVEEKGQKVLFVQAPGGK